MIKYVYLFKEIDDKKIDWLKEIKPLSNEDVRKILKKVNHFNQQKYDMLSMEQLVDKGWFQASPGIFDFLKREHLSRHQLIL